MVAMRQTAAVFVLALLLSPAAAGQRPPDGTPARSVSPDFAEMKSAVWTTAVRSHVAGSIDEPVRTIATWPREHVTAVVERNLDRLRRLRVARDPVARDLAELTGILVLGLSLHTDVALAEREGLAQRSSAGHGAAVLLVDGHEARRIDRSYHWTTARQIAAALAWDPGQGPRILAWYRAIAAGLEEWGDYDVAAVHLQEALARFPHDAVLLLYRGTLHQTLGDARLQQYMRGRQRDTALVVRRLEASNRPPRPALPELRRIPNTSQVQLETAEGDFRRALSADPALHEARIRLAHVLSTLADDRDAAETVRPALDAPLPPFLEYYAALILGRSEEHLGRYREAGEAYARAAARFPGAPSARLGRSRVALAQGRAAEALATLVEATRDDGPERGDPWLGYLRQHEPDGGSLLDAWRGTLK
jgi:tetratricopeptide (TPR) repeat protein